ncbi:MAG: glycosyltransferase family 1 protein, partial [Calditrichales bacterium]
MKVVYIHFHLKTGGVTTVLNQQVNAIRKDADVLVIAGTPPETPLSADTAVVDGLGYSTAPSDRHKSEAVADSVIAAVHRKWKDGCDLIHIHNATLAKNKNLLNILGLLQQQKFKLFIQIHDFAEDGRPSVYFQDQYPRDCHYGVINSRDYRVLLKSGLKKKGLHKLFNMIRPWDIQPLGPATVELALYPVRALRRKNIGEAILLSLFFRDKVSLAITLPPNSPVDIQSYGGWKAYVRQENLRVRFDAGLGADFRELVNSAKLMITTSVMEGFGFSFLEPWSAGKYLLGRKLPEICEDFEENGILLDHLYSRLNVPLEWIGRDNFFDRRLACIAANSDRFNYKIDPAQIFPAIQKSIIDNTVDFGILDERFQKIILSRILRSTADKNRLIECNP